MKFMDNFKNLLWTL